MARGWLKDEGLRMDSLVQTMRKSPEKLWTAWALGQEARIDPKVVGRLLNDRLLPAGIVVREEGTYGALWRLRRPSD